MPIFFLAFVLILMSPEDTIAMQRARKELPEISAFSLLAPHQDVQHVILGKVKIPETDLRLVCKMTLQFCENKNNKRWFFTKENYPSFKQEMGKPWVECLLNNLPSLSFHNPIEESSLNESDDLEPDAWEKKYIFVSQEDLEYIKKHSTNLRKLQLYNIPSLKTYLDSPFPCADSLISFSFDYDSIIFDASIDSTELEGCSQFTNLAHISIHSGIFQEEEAINYFFSPFTKLKTLAIYNVEADNNEGETRSTDLFRALSCLNNLIALNISFIQEPDFFSLTHLSSLNLLTKLSIDFNSPLNDEQTIIGPDVLPKLLSFLPNLQKITIDNGWLYCNKTDETKLLSVNSSLWKEYPKLKPLRGNMMLK